MVTTAIIPLVLALVVLGTQKAHAIHEDAYRSGFEHGCCAKDYAYNAAEHTQEFNQGYIDGFCAVNGKSAGSDSDQGTFECSLDATQYKNSTG